MTVRGLQTPQPDLMARLTEIMRRLDPEQVWTIKMVGEELVAATKLCNRIAGNVGPSNKQVAWPQALKELGDFLAVEPDDEEGRPQEPIRVTPTARQVSRMERAVGWVGSHLGGPEHDGMRRVLSLWLRCKAARKAKFNDAIKRKGWSKATAYRVRDRALLIIAIGLMEKGELP